MPLEQQVLSNSDRREKLQPQSSRAAQKANTKNSSVYFFVWFFCFKSHDYKAAGLMVRGGGLYQPLR